MIHLDTSFLIRALVPGTPEDARLRQWLRSRTAVAMSALAWAEFLCGPLGPTEALLARRFITEVVPFGPDDSVLAARLFSLSGRRRGSLADCMVAAAAIGADAGLATANAADFKRFVPGGLRLAH